MCDEKGEVFTLSPNLRELLGTRILIGDGAVGTLLGERGVGFGHPYARANLSHPKMVADIHVEYLRAGADAIETNTFAANRFKLENHDRRLLRDYPGSREGALQGAAGLQDRRQLYAPPGGRGGAGRTDGGSRRARL